jgi:large subunit ribosomal protein L29
VKPSEILELTSAEIEERIGTYKEELFNLRFQAAVRPLDNPKRIKQVRKNIARCKTILHERLLGSEGGPKS